MPEARALTAADLDPCLALSDEAGWNQIADDWRLILSAGEGLGLFREGRLIATAAIMPYGNRVGWICMVLVTASERRRGHASRLMRWAIERNATLGLVAGLDATPAGRAVYRRLGFEDVYVLTRWQAEAAIFDATSPAATRPLLQEMIDPVAILDETVFGADRRRVIEALYRQRPGLAFAAVEGGQIRGFVLGRSGRRATQIGPLVAASEIEAIALAQSAIAAAAGPVIIDVPDRHGRLIEWLKGAGFRSQRPFTRMLMQRSEPLDQPAMVFSITGPELG